MRAELKSTGFKTCLEELVVEGKLCTDSPASWKAKTSPNLRLQSGMVTVTVPVVEAMLKPSDPGLCLGDKISTQI